MAISILRALLQLLTPNDSTFLTNTNVIYLPKMIHIYSVLKFLLGNLNASLKVTYPSSAVMCNFKHGTQDSCAARDN